MTSKPCPKSWQVEAARDGRLTGQALMQAQQHIASCATCEREQDALAELSSQLREMDANVDQLALRRLRQLTLAKTDAVSRGEGLAVPVRPRWGAGHALVLAAASLALCLAAWRFIRAMHPVGIEVVATPSAGAVWTINRNGDIEYIDLVDGLLSVTVRHAGAQRRLIVRLPDGQVEDVGTRFRVWVSHGHTAEISVAEGAVVFRRAGESALSVHAGSAWRPAPASVEAVAASPESARSEFTAPSVPASAAPRSPRHVKAVGSARAEALMRVGDSAASMLTTDKEDAGYLHVVALLREHRDEEARLAAITFLRDFPKAFRRPELERMIQSVGASKIR